MAQLNAGPETYPRRAGRHHRNHRVGALPDVHLQGPFFTPGTDNSAGATSHCAQPAAVIALLRVERRPYNRAQNEVNTSHHVAQIIGHLTTFDNHQPSAVRRHRRLHQLGVHRPRRHDRRAQTGASRRVRQYDGDADQHGEGLIGITTNDKALPSGHRR